MEEVKGGIGMEFEKGDMFGFPSIWTQHVHNDAVALAQENAPSLSDDSVMALLW